jgi:hypothetical protein
MPSRNCGLVERGQLAALVQEAQEVALRILGSLGPSRRPGGVRWPGLACRPRPPTAGTCPRAFLRVQRPQRSLQERVRVEAATLPLAPIFAKRGRRLSTAAAPGPWSELAPLATAAALPRCTSREDTFEPRQRPRSQRLSDPGFAAAWRPAGFPAPPPAGVRLRCRAPPSSGMAVAQGGGPRARGPKKAEAGRRGVVRQGTWEGSCEWEGRARGEGLRRDEGGWQDHRPSCTNPCSTVPAEAISVAAQRPQGSRVDPAGRHDRGLRKRTATRALASRRLRTAGTIARGGSGACRLGPAERLETRPRGGLGRRPGESHLRRSAASGKRGASCCHLTTGVTTAELPKPEVPVQVRLAGGRRASQGTRRAQVGRWGRAAPVRTGSRAIQTARGKGLRRLRGQGSAQTSAPGERATEGRRRRGQGHGSVGKNLATCVCKGQRVALRPCLRVSSSSLPPPSRRRLSPISDPRRSHPWLLPWPPPMSHGSRGLALPTTTCPGRVRLLIPPGGSWPECRSRAAELLAPSGSPRPGPSSGEARCVLGRKAWGEVAEVGMGVRTGRSHWWPPLGIGWRCGDLATQEGRSEGDGGGDGSPRGGARDSESPIRPNAEGPAGGGFREPRCCGQRASPEARPGGPRPPRPHPSSPGRYTAGEPPKAVSGLRLRIIVRLRICLTLS